MRGAPILCFVATIGSKAWAQDKDGFWNLRDALAAGYEVKAVVEKPPTRRDDPSDNGADIIYLQKGRVLLVCVGPKYKPTPQKPVPDKVGSLCREPEYLE